MSLWCHRSHYAQLLVFAGYEPEDTPTVEEIIDRLGAVLSVRSGNVAGNRRGCIEQRDGRTFIVLKRNLRGHRRRYTKAHELAEWQLRKLGYTEDPQIEVAADSFALVLLAPRQAILELTRDTYPTDFAEVAHSLEISELEAAARIAEERSLPVAALRGDEVLFAGPPFRWGPRKAMRTLAEAIIERRTFHPFIQAARAQNERNLIFLWVE